VEGRHSPIYQRERHVRLHEYVTFTPDHSTRLRSHESNLTGIDSVEWPAFASHMSALGPSPQRRPTRRTRSTHQVLARAAWGGSSSRRTVLPAFIPHLCWFVHYRSYVHDDFWTLPRDVLAPREKAPNSRLYQSSVPRRFSRTS
jgi:hypothetical protein